MGPAGRLVTIKRSGADGPHFPLSLSSCLFGRGIECDIRIQLPVVSRQHCKIEISERKAVLFNFSSANPTRVNGSAVAGPVPLRHGDVITVVDRSFRYEDDSRQSGSTSAEFPGQRHGQAAPRRASRSSFSSDPDGEVEGRSAARSQLTEEGVSGAPPACTEGVGGAHAVSRSSGGPAARSPRDGHRSDPLRDNHRNAASPPAGGLGEGSRGTLVSRNGGPEPFPSPWCLEKGGEKESPFRKLYESMKEELDVKSEKENVLQNRRKSGSRGHCAADSESAGGSWGETPLQGSLKSRRRSRRSSQTKAAPALGPGQPEEERTGERPGPTLEATTSPGVPAMETTNGNTPVQGSLQNSPRRRQGRGQSGSRGSGPAGPEQGAGFRADSAAFTPKELFPGHGTPTTGRSANENTPEKVFSRKRRSSPPPKVDILTTETEIPKPALLTPLLVHVERKVPGGLPGSPQPLGAAAGSPGLSSVDVGNLDESIHKMEGVPLKTRRVSFGGHLRPELFDENLPPNTPLKRGETPVKRRSLVAHAPAVLKKIIKEQPQEAGKEDSSEIHVEVTEQNVFMSSPACHPSKSSSVANDGRRRSSKPPASSGSQSPHVTDVPKRGGRRSSGVPSKRASMDRAQHEILQRIHSRRSGASEANLIVAKSWADIVKLSAKQTQTKVVKPGPPRQLSKRQRRVNTPKKPTGLAYSEFSTGHANSPCTIVIGKAHVEKVAVPARPYRTLNNFVFDKKIDFSEDLSGLTEMFKTPAKEKPKKTSFCPTAFSNSEDSLGKQVQVPKSEGKPLLCTPAKFGENVFPSAQNAPEEPSDKKAASPTPRRQYVTVNKNPETPPSDTEPPKAASSANKSRRSVGPSNAQAPGTGREKEDAELDTVESISGRCLRKSPVQAPLAEGKMKDSERAFATCKENIESKENSEKRLVLRRSRRSSEPQCAPRTDVITTKRLQETESKEDVVGTHCFLQTPGQAEAAVGMENKATMMCSSSPNPEPISTPAKMNGRIQTPSQNVGAEAISVLRKPSQTPGDTKHTHKEPGDGDKSKKVSKKTPEQQQDSAEHVTGSRRRPRTPKKPQSIEDLAGLKELFQTPNHIMETMTEDKTMKIPCKSPKPEPVNTPTSTKRRLRTPLGKVDMEEELLALRKSTSTPGEATHSPGEPEGDSEGVKALNGTPEQKQDSAQHVTGSRRRSRTPKRKVEPIEDLTGFKELFQTPNHIVEPVTEEKTMKIPSKSPKPEPVSTPTSTKRRLRTPLGKVDVEKELSALRKSTPTPEEAINSPGKPEGDSEGVKALKRTPEQKRDSAQHVTGSRRRSRTPKRKVQPTEDLTGFKELFQTPNHIMETMTENKTMKIPCKSPKPEPVNTPTSTKRRLRTALGKVDVEKELSTLKKSTSTPGEATHSPGEPEGGNESVKALKGTPEQKQDSAQHVTGSRRRSRTPKRKVEPIEDLTGFKELFQTPNHVVETATDDKTTKIPSKSPKSEPLSTPTSTKRRLRTALGKVDVEEELSALSKSTSTPGEAIHSPGEPEGGAEGVKALKGTPEQKWDSAQHVTRSRRRSRTPKRKVEPIDDLTGFKELFQTPNHIVELVTEDKTMKIPSKSPKPEPVSTSTSTKRRLRTALGKVDVEEELSALSKSTPTPGEATHSPGEPEGGDEGVKLLKGTPEQKQDSAQHVTGSRRRSRTPKRKVEPIEDLTGFKELFQTPNHVVETATDDKTTKIPSKSPKPKPVGTPTKMKGQIKIPSQGMGAEALSILRNPTQTPGNAEHTHKEPVGGDESMKASKKFPEQQQDSAEHVTRRRRRSRTPKKKAQPIEDLAGFKELFQTPNHTDEPMTEDITTEIPSKSPQPEPFSTLTDIKGRLRIPLGKVDVEEEFSGPRKPTQTSGKIMCSPRDPVGDDEDITALKGTPEQKRDSAEHVTRSRRRSRTPKGKVQPREDLTGFKELFQTPNHIVEPVTKDKTMKIPSKSPKPEPVSRPTSTKRRLRTPLGKVDVEKELSALSKSTPTPEKATHSPGEPGDNEGVKALKGTPEQKRDSAQHVTGRRRRSRTPTRVNQPIEDLTGFKELFQTPNHTVESMIEDKATKMPSKSAHAKPAVMATGRNRRLKALPGKLAVKDEPSALWSPIRTSRRTTRSHREPEGGNKDMKLFKEFPEQKLDPAENGTASKRRPRTRKEKAQFLADPASLKEQIPNHTEDPVPVADTTEMPSRSLQAEAVIMPARTRRQLKAPPGTVAVQEEPSALQRPMGTSGKTTRSRREPIGGAKDIEVCKGSPRREPGPAGNAVGSGHLLRSRKGKAQPPPSPADSKQRRQSPAQDKGLGTDAVGVTRNSTQTPDQSKPVTTSRRALRALNIKPTEELVDSRDPVNLQSDSSVVLSSKRKREDGSCAGARRLRPRTCAQDTAEEKPPRKRQRTAPGEQSAPPEPSVPKKGRRVLRGSTELVDDLPSTNGKTKNKGQKEDVTSPDKGVSLRSSLPDKTDGAEQRPERLISAEKVQRKRNEKKPVKSSQEAEIQNLEGGAQNSAPGDKVHERRMSPRPGRRGKVPVPRGAEEKARASSMETHGKAREEKEGAPHSGFICLRSRKVTVPPAGDTSESQSKQRVTRSAKRPAEEANKENDDKSVKKMRTRSRRGQ